MWFSSTDSLQTRFRLFFISVRWSPPPPPPPLRHLGLSHRLSRGFLPPVWRCDGGLSLLTVLDLHPSCPPSALCGLSHRWSLCCCTDSSPLIHQDSPSLMAVISNRISSHHNLSCPSSPWNPLFYLMVFYKKLINTSCTLLNICSVSALIVSSLNLHTVLLNPTSPPQGAETQNSYLFLHWR